MLGFIYQIKCKSPEVTDLYIGSTVNYKHRVCNHKTEGYKKKQHLPLYSCIYKNGGLDNWTFEILEEYTCETRQDLYKRERVYYEAYEPSLNIFRPFIHHLDSKRLCDEKHADKRYHARQQRYYADPEKHRAAAREYYQKNKEKILAYDRSRRDRINELRREATARRKQERLMMSMEDHDC